jgi:hypothetical protein
MKDSRTKIIFELEPNFSQTIKITSSTPDAHERAVAVLSRCQTHLALLESQLQQALAIELAAASELALQRKEASQPPVG